MKRSAVVVVLVVSIGGFHGAPLLAEHEDSVKGSWTSAPDPSLDCPSPIGVCRTGKLLNPAGRQIGVFDFVMDTLTPRPDGSMHFSGSEVQIYDDGTMAAEDEGVIDPQLVGPHGFT